MYLLSSLQLLKARTLQVWRQAADVNKICAIIVDYTCTDFTKVLNIILYNKINYLQCFNCKLRLFSILCSEFYQNSKKNSVSHTLIPQHISHTNIHRVIAFNVCLLPLTASQTTIITTNYCMTQIQCKQETCDIKNKCSLFWLSVQ